MSPLSFIPALFVAFGMVWLAHAMPYGDLPTFVSASVPIGTGAVLLTMIGRDFMDYLPHVRGRSLARRLGVLALTVLSVAGWVAGLTVLDALTTAGTPHAMPAALWLLVETLVTGAVVMILADRGRADHRRMVRRVEATIAAHEKPSEPA